jgi:hypothetical protein
MHSLVHAKKRRRITAPDDLSEPTMLSAGTGFATATAHGLYNDQYNSPPLNAATRVPHAGRLGVVRALVPAEAEVSLHNAKQAAWAFLLANDSLDGTLT